MNCSSLLCIELQATMDPYAFTKVNVVLVEQHTVATCASLKR